MLLVLMDLMVSLEGMMSSVIKNQLASCFPSGSIRFCILCFPDVPVLCEMTIAETEAFVVPDLGEHSVIHHEVLH